uniref:MFS domain-containing protein n=1 Tax=Panagrellus redivivus TaxID=6233 RepID=A0A7E4ZQG1_PANRE
MKSLIDDLYASKHTRMETDLYAYNPTAMEWPSKWLTAAILIHGLLGGFGEVIDLVLMRMNIPLAAFYNQSMELHYDINLNDAGVTQLTSWIANLGQVGSVVAVILVVPRMDTWGRKTVAVYFRSAIGAISALMMIASKSFVSVELFALSQLFIGFIRPLRIGVNKMYMSECAPDHLRGFATQSVSTGTMLIMVLGGLTTTPQVFGNDDLWYMIGVVALGMIIIYVTAASFLPDSPKFMSYTGMDKKKVGKVIRKYHGKDADIPVVLHSYTEEFHLTTHHHLGFREAWNDLGLRDSLYIVFVAALVPAIGPTQIFFVYAIPLKLRYGFTLGSANAFDFIAGMIMFPLAFALPYLYERIGRKPLFILSLALSFAGITLMLVAQLVFVAQGHQASVWTVIFAGLFTIVVGLSNGLGSLVFYIILAADLLPASAKASTTTAALLVNFLAGIVMNFYYATFEPIIGGTVLLPIILAQAFFLIYEYRNLPETRLRPVADNFEVVRSRAVSRRHSLLPSQFDSNVSLLKGYGTTE